MNVRIAGMTALVLAGTLALAGCASSTMAGMSGMEMSGTPTDGSPMGSSAAAFNSSDVQFAMMMVPHHQQAISMSDALLAKPGIDVRVTDLAKKIKAEQAPEITTMNTWLTEWSAGSGSMSTMNMGGMMSQSDMAALDAATGVDAAKLYLTQMITHHSGAIDMAKTEIADGQNADAIALAQRITTSQAAEITTMQTLLAGL